MRKIRGNLVGTTMSPEKIAERIGGGGGGSAEGAVLYNAPQNLPPEKQAQARDNINAVGYETETVCSVLNDKMPCTEVSTYTIDMTAINLGKLSLNSAWTTRYFTASEDFELYVSDDFNLRYFKMAIYNGEVSKNNLVEKVYYGSNNDLPKAANKLQVMAGQTVAFSGRIGESFEVIKETKVRHYISVNHNEPQTLTNKQQAQAKENIGVLSDCAHTALYEKYFDIDFDGVVSLRPEYRGHSDADVESVAPHSISDKGVGKVGSKFNELPERLVVPQIIDGEKVTSFQKGAFAFNHKIKEVVIPIGIKTIPSGLFWGAINLKKVENTEQIETVNAHAFRLSGIEEIRFPNATTIKGNSFQECSLLRVVDIGKITSIGNFTFAYCEDLSEVLGGDGVTSIGGQAFLGTRRLKSIPFISNVTSVGVLAFYGSRCNIDELKASAYKSSQYAVYKQYNVKNGALYDYWSGVEYTPCKNPLNSLFHQKDPRWADKPVNEVILGDDGKPNKYRSGCAFCTLAEIYSAYEGVSFDSPVEFANLLTEKFGDSWKSHNYRYRSGWCALAEMLGYETKLIAGDYQETGVQEEITKETLKEIYDALRDGALLYRGVGVVTTGVNEKGETTYSVQTDGGHATLIYGVNKDGEVLLSDTSQKRSNLGIYENHKSAQPIYTHGSQKCDVVIVRAPKFTVYDSDGSTSHRFASGMSWNEFVQSEYNQVGFAVDELSGFVTLNGKYLNTVPYSNDLGAGNYKIPAENTIAIANYYIWDDET